MVAYLFIHNVYVFMAGTFMFGMMRAGTYSVGYVLCVEHLPKSHRKLSLLIDLTEGAVIIYIVIYLRFISRDWTGAMLFGAALTFLGTTICALYIRETPRFLMAKGLRGPAVENL